MTGVQTCALPISENFPIANMRNTDAGVELRIVAERKPVPGAKNVQATLEDAFLFYFGERTEESE